MTACTATKEIKKLLPAEVIGEIPAIVNPCGCANAANRKALVGMGDGCSRICYHIWPDQHSVICAANSDLCINASTICSGILSRSRPIRRFCFATKKHNEALAALYYGVKRHKGFVVLTGEVGTGKTLLVRCLLRIAESRAMSPMPTSSTRA